MPYTGPIGFARITNLFMNVFIGIVLGILFLVLTNDLSVMTPSQIARSFAQSLIMSVLVGYAVGDFLPTLDLANKVNSALKVRSRLLRHLVTSAVLTLVNVTVILALCMLITLLAAMSIFELIAVVVSLWPSAVVAGFVAIFALLPVAQHIAKMVSGFDPDVAV